MFPNTSLLGRLREVWLLIRYSGPLLLLHRPYGLLRGLASLLLAPHWPKACISSVMPEVHTTCIIVQIRRTLLGWMNSRRIREEMRTITVSQLLTSMGQNT